MKLAVIVSIVIVLGGCSKEDDCAIGSERCACTTGGACNPGLACMSNTCVNTTVGPSPDGGGPSAPSGAIDVLFVIDNSASMQEEQTNLSRSFPSLLAALRNPALGPDGSGKPCSVSDPSGCQIPDIRVGVVSTDLGAGAYDLPSCGRPGGDKGQLMVVARSPGCTAPTNPWISYSNGQSNVTTGGDHIQRVSDAFACIGSLGVDGCGMEHPLEAARRALDPALGVNPGFLRSHAALAVIFVTDEDDCSAVDTSFFDPDPALQAAFGPLTSFRCFRHGIKCNGTEPAAAGPYSNCQPDGTKLHPIQEYEQFFRSLKPSGKVVMAAIAGPSNPVVVAMDGPQMVLVASCTSANGSAMPGIRIKTLVERFNGLSADICQADYTPTLRQVGLMLAAK